MVRRRRAATAVVTLGLAFAPVVTSVARAHAQFVDAEGADGGDVSGGDGGVGASGVLPTGSQNNAQPGDTACFSDIDCDVFGDSGSEWPAVSDSFETEAFFDGA